ncbi:hypothetical protein, partial [Roseibium sp.]|uniref:hypothetical protein n=1 Tax=Roseibium sp. TaxID=1936156 RepID=UPI003299DD6A
MRNALKSTLWILSGILCYAYYGFPEMRAGALFEQDPMLLCTIALWGICCVLINALFRALARKQS